MDLKELSDLITIRQYVVNSTGNMSLDRPTVNELNGILILLDKKIVGILKGTEFKDYIGYEGVKQAIEDVVRITNIKSGLKK
jgi:hypothetical protein